MALNINLKSEWDFSNTKRFRECKIKWPQPNYKRHSVSSDNFEQKVADKLKKLRKIAFCMECFTSDFLKFFTKNCLNLAFGRTAE